MKRLFSDIELQAVQICAMPEKGNKQNELCLSWLSAWNSPTMLVGMENGIATLENRQFLLKLNIQLS